MKKSKIFVIIFWSECAAELRTPLWCRVALRASDTHTTYYTQPPLGAQKIKSSFWLFAKESLHQRDSQLSQTHGTRHLYLYANLIAKTCIIIIIIIWYHLFRDTKWVLQTTTTIVLELNLGGAPHSCQNCAQLVN